MPQPAGPRTAYIRIPEPIYISADTDVTEAIEKLRLHMQTTLDEVNAELDAKGNAITYRNVFVQ